MKKSNAMLEKENKDLRAEIKERDGLRERATEKMDQARVQLEAAQHELVHFKQTVRSLHWALSTATGVIQKAQREAKEFAVGINIQEPSEGKWVVEKSVWAKTKDVVALAE